MIQQKQEEKISSELISNILDHYRSENCIDTDIACDMLGEFDLQELTTRQIKKLAQSVTVNKLKCRDSLFSLYKSNIARNVEIWMNIEYQVARFSQEWKKRKQLIFKNWVNNKK